jgi:hypothetical protein
MKDKNHAEGERIYDKKQGTCKPMAVLQMNNVYSPNVESLYT